MAKVRVILSLEMDVDLWADKYKMDGFFAARSNIRDCVAELVAGAFGPDSSDPAIVSVVEDKTIGERNARKRSRGQRPAERPGESPAA